MNNFTTIIEAKKMIQKGGGCGLYLFALGAWMSTAVANLGLGLMLIAFLLKPKNLSYLKKDPIVLTSILFAAYLAIRTYVAIWEFPSTRSYQIEFATELFKSGFLLIFLIGFWIAERPKHLPNLFMLMLIGFIVRIVINFDYENIGHIFQHRQGFEMGANVFGLYAGITLLGLIIFAPRFLGPTSRPFNFALRALLWMCFLVVFVSGILMARSKGVWLIGCILVPLTIIIQLKTLKKTASKKVPQFLIAYYCIAVLTILGIVIMNKNLVKQRLKSDSLSIHLTTDSSQLKPGSFNVRLYLASIGLEKWQQRPFFGWGPGSTEYLVKHYDVNFLRKSSIRRSIHLHNSFLQILVQVGLIGMIFFTLMFGWVFQVAWKAFRQRWLAPDIFLFTAFALLFFLLANFFYFRINDHYGKFFIAIFCGIAYSFRISGSINGASRSNEINIENRPQPKKMC